MPLPGQEMGTVVRITIPLDCLTPTFFTSLAHCGRVFREDHWPGGEWMRLPSNTFKQYLPLRSYGFCWPQSYLTL